LHPSHAAFLQFWQVIRSVVSLSEAQQLRVLKCELLRALERGHDFQSRCRALELDLERLKSLGAYSRRELRARFAELHHRLLDAGRGRPSAEADRRRLLHDVQLELLETVVHCQALEATCRVLLRRMDRPDPGPVVDGRTEPLRESRVSAR
jgi:hypothetical protein